MRALEVGHRIEVIDRELNPRERRDYLGLEGEIIDSACELGINGLPVDYGVQLEGYKKPVRFYPESLNVVKKK